MTVLHNRRMRHHNTEADHALVINENSAIFNLQTCVFGMYERVCHRAAVCNCIRLYARVQACVEVMCDVALRRLWRRLSEKAWLARRFLQQRCAPAPSPFHERALQ